MERSFDFLKGKTALITGATGEIGHAIANRVAEYGVRLVITGRIESTLNERAAELRANGCEVYPIVGNLESMAFLDELITFTIEKCGSLDILINNAGMAHHNLFEDVTPEMFDSIMNVNVRAPFFLCQKALPYLKISDAATVINIGSVVSHKGYKYQSVFTTSKHALLGVSKALACETYEEDIRVHVISPGAVYTDLIKLLRPDLDPSELILPTDIADIVAFHLEHRKSAFVVDETRMHRVDKEPQF